MSEPQCSSVHRYFSLADSFLEIRQFGLDADCLHAPDGLDQSGYKHLVVSTCMPQFASDLMEQLPTLFPEDPQAAQDLLYDLCVEVNPGLEIGRVNLKTAGSDPQPRTQVRTQRPSVTEDPFKHLAGVSRTLKRRLSRNVHGQNAAIDAVCLAVERSAAGLAAANRPLGSFLFVGRTGTGKTELARQLARELARGKHDIGNNLLRIDCSEYALAHEHSKLLGSPPGYIGHEDGGQFRKALIENPQTVILFDEVEKAHPRMHNLLLQILEEGCLTDGQGKRISLEQNFVLMTSNAGAEDIRKATRAVGFQNESSLSSESLGSITEQALEQTFSPEFLGRLDQVVLFSELEQVAAVAIAQSLLTQLSIRACHRGARVAFTPAVARWVVETGFSREFGARELRSVIQRDVEPPLARIMLNEALGDDDLIRVRVKHGSLSLFVER